nr:putative reverse transcriptase domain-containing protein [Tanacetum cinerariifolium]
IDIMIRELYDEVDDYVLNQLLVYKDRSKCISLRLHHFVLYQCTARTENAIEDIVLLQASDKAMLLQAKENGALLDVEAEAFLVNHEDTYDLDVDNEPNAAAAFMANLSSSSNQINEVRTFNDNIFETVSPSWPSEASPIPPTAAYMLQTLTDLTTQVEGHRKVNQEQALVYATLSVELDQCKLELARLERNKVQLECDHVIVACNKRNAKLKQETELLKTILKNKEATIASLTSETKTVLSEKKTLEDKYLEEIVCLKNANQVATGLLQKFQLPTQTIPMLSKRPMIISNDIHKIGLGLSNSWFGRKAQLSQPTLEHVYWLSASDIASQSGDPPKPVTPFVQTRPVNSEVHTKVWKIKECLTPFEEVIKKRTAPPSDVLYHRSLDKNALETKITQLKDNISSLRIQNDGYKIEIANHTRRYLELSKASTYSCNTSNEKIAALNAEIAKMKPSGSGTKVSGPKTPEKPKVVVPWMYAIIGEAQILGPKLIQETTEKIVQIKQRMQAAHDRQKSYADLKRKPMEFQVGDKVMLKFSPWKGVERFGKWGKLNPRYVGPFKVFERIGDVAYKLDLLEELSRVHNTFHVSNLKKCHADEPLTVPLDRLHFDDKLQFVEDPVEIVDREVKRLDRS